MCRSVVIVGAGLAGSRCAQTLRAEGFDGSIALVGEEPHQPYERPALSKEFLAGTREELLLQGSTAWAELEIDLELGVRERIDTTRRLASTSRGDMVWDALVLATGARARRPAAFGGSGVHVLRTLDDARRLRAELVPGRRLGIVGSGFVGTEVASTAVELGVDVTIIDLATLPFELTLGPEVGRLLADRYREHGVALRLGAGVESMLRRSDGALRGLRLSNGMELECELVLVAVGAEPAGELLLGASGPIETDEGGRTGLPSVFACGDVAAPWSAERSRHVRLEHWTSAAEQAASVARAILGREPRARPTPYFWSDQFGLRLQHVGSAGGWERIVLDGDETSLVARYLAQDGRLVSALLVNRPQQVGAVRRELAPELLAA